MEHGYSYSFYLGIIRVNNRLLSCLLNLQNSGLCPLENQKLIKIIQDRYLNVLCILCGVRIALLK